MKMTAVVSRCDKGTNFLVKAKERMGDRCRKCEGFWLILHSQNKILTFQEMITQEQLKETFERKLALRRYL